MKVPGQISGSKMPSLPSYLALGWWNILCDYKPLICRSNEECPSFFLRHHIPFVPDPQTPMVAWKWLFSRLTSKGYERWNYSVFVRWWHKGCSWGGSELWHLPRGHQAECQVSNNHLPYRTYNNLPWLLTIITFLGYLYIQKCSCLREA